MMRRTIRTWIKTCNREGRRKIEKQQHTKKNNNQNNNNNNNNNNHIMRNYTEKKHIENQINVAKLIQMKKEIQQYKKMQQMQQQQQQQQQQTTIETNNNNKNQEQQRGYNSKIGTTGENNNNHHHHHQEGNHQEDIQNTQRVTASDAQVLQQQIQLHQQKAEIKHIVSEECKKQEKKGEKVEYKPENGQPVVMNGKKLSLKIKNDLKKRIKQDKKTTEGRVPGLALILVGSKKNSQSYINTKRKTSEQLGMKSNIYRLEEDTSTEEMIKLIKNLNRERNIHGIVVQLPLPEHINAEHVIHAIDPEKDVDMFQSKSSATAFGVRDLLEYYYCQGDPEEGYRSIMGKHVVIVGRSQYVGRPIADLFLNEDNCTVTIVHERTPPERRKELTRAGDIVILVCGVSELVRGEDISEGSILIDVGVNEVWEIDENKKETTKKIRRITGDCHYNECAEIADYITPVPGGVGPMTIMRLMQNTYAAYRNLENVAALEKRQEVHTTTTTHVSPILAPSTPAPVPQQL